MGVDVSTYRARIGSFFLGGPAGAFESVLVMWRPHSLVFYCQDLVFCSQPRASPCCFFAGDIEANPGPKTEDVINLLKEFMAVNEQKWSSTFEILNKIKQDVDKTGAQVGLIEQNMNGVSELKNYVSSVRGSVNKVKSAVSKTNTKLSGVVDDLNNRSRRNNLLVKGMPDSDGEDYVSTERKVINTKRKDFINTNLNLNLEFNDFERAHRIGA